jgi:indolepyruvate ferredoxin oxidoreductase beta subunit
MAALDGTTEAPADVHATVAPASVPRDATVRTLLERVRREFPDAAQTMLVEGVRRTIDFQDPAYAGLYLDRVARVLQSPGGRDSVLLNETARHLALWMTYEDTIRVADLKTRASRFDRVSAEVRARDDQVLAINEFMHPRLQEICETLPAGLGRWLAASGAPRRLVERGTRKGRIINTTSLRGFLMLYLLARMKRWRRGTLRYEIEDRRIEQWLQRIVGCAKNNPQLAAEVAQCQRLVKGYSDTHERGLRNYEAVMAALDAAGTAMAPATLRELRDAALADEHGDKLRATLARVAAPMAAAATQARRETPVGIS